MATPESRPRIQICSPLSDGGGDLQLPANPEGNDAPKWSRPNGLALPEHGEPAASGASPREEFPSDSSTTTTQEHPEISGDEAFPGHAVQPNRSGSGVDTTSPVAGREMTEREALEAGESRSSARKRSRVLRFEAGSATVDNKMRQGYGFVPVGRSPGASPGASPTDGVGSSFPDNHASASFSSPRRSSSGAMGSPRRRSTSILSPAAFAADLDTERDSNEPETKREREVIQPEDLPRVGMPAARSFERDSKLMWLPHDTATVDKFISQARAILRSRALVMAHDALLELLMRSGFSIPAAIEALAVQPQLVHVKEGLGRKFDYWSEDEVGRFEEGYIYGGKDFPAISRKVQSRSVHECISFYYTWKKTVRGTAALLEHKKILQQPLHFHPLKQLFIPMPDALQSEDERSSRSRENSPVPTAAVGGDRTPTKKQRKRATTTSAAGKEKRPKVAPDQPERSRKKAGKGKSRSAKGQRKSHHKPKEDIFIVEDIIEERMNGNKPEYLVKWQDYPTEDATWEPETNLKNNIVLKAHLFRKQQQAGN